MNKARIEYWKVAKGGYDAMLALESYLKASGTEPTLIYMTKLRASQINGCAYCIDMHWKELRALGEPEHRLYALDAWRESPHYTDKERAALEWAETVTRIGEGVSDAAYDRARSHLSEKELADLTMCAAGINAWNRLAIAMRMPVPAPKPAR